MTFCKKKIWIINRKFFHSIGRHVEFRYVLRIKVAMFNISLISVHCARCHGGDYFYILYYNKLELDYSAVPRYDLRVVIGYFNAQDWPGVMILRTWKSYKSIIWRTFRQTSRITHIILGPNEKEEEKCFFVFFCNLFGLLTFFEKLCFWEKKMWHVLYTFSCVIAHIWQS